MEYQITPSAFSLASTSSICFPIASGLRLLFAIRHFNPPRILVHYFTSVQVFGERHDKIAGCEKQPPRSYTAKAHLLLLPIAVLPNVLSRLMQNNTFRGRGLTAGFLDTIIMLGSGVSLTPFLIIRVEKKACIVNVPLTLVSPQGENRNAALAVKLNQFAVRSVNKEAPRAHPADSLNRGIIA